MKKSTMVKRGTALLLAATLLAGSTMTVFAEETNEIKNDYSYSFFGKHDVEGDDYEDSGKAEYHDDEAKKVADNSESVKTMSEQAEAAKDAANTAAQQVDNLEAAINDAKAAQTDAKAAEEAATTAATNATTAATEAKNVADALPTDTQGSVDAFNEKVEDTQKAVDQLTSEINVVQTPDGIVVGTVTDADGQEKDVTLEEYVGEQAGEAANQAQAAKDNLEAALAIAVTNDTQDVPEDVKKLAQDAIDAANKAEEAADKAKEAYNATIAQRDKAIEVYNLLAMASGKPLYGMSSLTYSEEDAKAKLAGTKYEYLLTDRKELESNLSAINQANLDAQKSVIESADEAMDGAKSDYDSAKADAAEAKTTAQTAESLLSGALEDVKNAADEAINYYVTPATEKLNHTKADIDTKTTEMGQLQTRLTEQQSAYDKAVSDARAAGENKYSTDEKNRLEQAMNKAEEEFEDSKAFWNLWLGSSDKKDKYEAAKKLYDNYTRENLGNQAVANSKEVKKAKDAVEATKTNISATNSAIADLEAAKVVQEEEVKAAQKVRDEYLEASLAETKEAFREDIAKALKDCSAQINQVEYDRVLNECVNEFWSSLSKKAIRNGLDETYQASKIQTIFNYLGITQWAVSTDATNAIMDEIEAACKNRIKESQEKLATAEANWAQAEAQASKEKADALEDIAPIVNDINAYETTVTEARETVDAAQETYDTAAEKLENIKASVENCNLNGIYFDNLAQEIAKAQAALLKAEDELMLAKAAEAQAEGYKFWAKKLLFGHYANIYAQAVMNADGNMTLSNSNQLEYDLTDEEVELHNSDNFIPVGEQIEVPYSIYRAYVDAMYQRYLNFSEDANGKGISTGGTMPTLYWELNEDGQLTGNYFDTDADRPTGTYFIGYSFKNELGGYRLDGVVEDYVKPQIPEEYPEDGGEDDTAPEADTDPTEGDTTPDTTPIAINPVVNPVTNQEQAPVAALAGQVLGANRVGATQTAVAEANGTTESEELSADVEQEDVVELTEEEEKQEVVNIEEEDVALADGITKKGFNWWWLLLLLAVAVVTEEVIRRNQKNKAKTSSNENK